MLLMQTTTQFICRMPQKQQRDLESVRTRASLCISIEPCLTVRVARASKADTATLLAVVVALSKCSHSVIASALAASLLPWILIPVPSGDASWLCIDDIVLIKCLLRKIPDIPNSRVLPPKVLSNMLIVMVAGEWAAEDGEGRKKFYNFNTNADR